MKTFTRWFALFVALALLPACSVPPQRAATPAIDSPLVAPTAPATAMPVASPLATEIPPATLPATETAVATIPATATPVAAAPATETPMTQPQTTPEAPQVDPGLIVQTTTPAQPGMEAPADSPAVQAAVAALAQQLSIDPQAIKVVSVEQVEWSDGCLGLGRPDQACLQVIVPGFRVMLEANGAQYEVRTNLNGKQVAIAPRP